MAVESLGLEMAVTGLNKFLSDVKKGDDAVDSSESKWSKLTSTAAAAGKQMQTVGKVALGAVAAGATAAVAAVGGLVVGLGKLAMEAAPVKGVADAFAGVAEASGKSADDMLAALQRGSAGMVAQRDLMATYNTAAQLVGTTFANQLPDAMGYLGKVSAATGEDMSYMLDSLVKGVGRLSPMILDNLGIQVNLTEANEAYAKSIGVATSELTKEQQQAALMAQVMQKLETNTAAMPDVLGSAAANMATLKARFQDTKDAIGLAVLPILNQLMGVLGNLADKYLPVVIGAVEGLATTVSTILPFVQSFFAMLQQGYDPLQALNVIIPLLLGELGVMGGTVDAVKLTIGSIIEKFHEFVATVQPIAEQIIAWIVDFVSWKDVLIALAIAVASVVIPAVAAFVASIAPVIATVIAVVAIIALLRKAWESDFGGIQGKTKAVIEFVRNFITAALTFIREFWMAHGEQIKATVVQMWELIRTTVVTIATQVQEFIAEVLAAIQEFWFEHGEEIVATAQAMWDTIMEIVDWAAKQVKLIIDAFIALFQGDWRRFGEKIGELWANAWLAIMRFLADIQPKIVEAVGTLIQNIIDFFMETDWMALGQSIIEGIVQGVIQAASALIRAVVDVVQGALSAAKEAIGASSPSQLFRVELGRPIGEGTALGVADMAPLVKSQIQSIVSPGIGGSGGGSSSVMSNVGNTTNQFNLTSQSVMRPGGLEMEFDSMQVTR